MLILFFERYEVEKELEQDIFTFSDQYQLKTYKGIDKTEASPILIRAMNITLENDSLHSFIYNFWNYELRATRKALAATKGKNITRLVDAQYDKENSTYIIVFEHPGSTLRELLSSKNKSKKIFSQKKELRRLLWQAFLNLTEALRNMHQNYILHRNLSLNSIYWDSKEENFAKSLSIGNFSMSIYLHSLFQQLSSNKIQRASSPKKKWSIYCAPEVVGASDSRSFSGGENFSSDLFSLGIIFAQCLLGEVLDTEEFTSIEKYQNGIEKIAEKVNDNSKFVDYREQVILRGLISLDSSQRFSDSVELIDAIKDLIITLKSEDIKIIESPFPVFFKDDPEKSYFFRELSETLDLFGSLDERLRKIYNWLRDEFKEIALFPSSHDTQLIWTRGKSGTIYSFRPFFSSTSREEFPIGVIHFEFKPSGIIPSPIPPPICYMINGLSWATGDFNKYLDSPWGDAFAQAKDWRVNFKKKEWSIRDKFEKRLELMLEAEEILELVNVIPFEQVNISRNETKKLEEKYPNSIFLKIKLLFDQEHPEYGKINYNSMDSIMEEILNESNRKVDLSTESMPYGDFLDENVWDVMKWKTKNSTILLIKEPIEGEILQPSSGFMRPWSLKLSSLLYYRKKRGLDTLLSNRQLTDTLLEPKYNIFFPEGLGTSEDIYSKIMTTIPIFLIQGPPGTGKTFTAVETINKILKKNPSARILVSSKEHDALNDLVLKIVNMILEIELSPQPILIRLISPDKEQEYARYQEIRNHFSLNVTKQITQNVLETPISNNLGKLKEEWRDFMKKELIASSTSWLRTIRKSASIVCTTMTAAELQAVRKYDPPFDWIIIEEAGKAYPTELGLALTCGNRWILIGDQKQLPPYLQEKLIKKLNQRLLELKEEEFSEFSETEFNTFREELIKDTKYFGHLYSLYEKTKYYYASTDQTPIHRLNEQYRMTPVISNMISEIFYDGTFKDHVEPLPPNSLIKSPEWLGSHELIWIETKPASQSEEALENRTGKRSLNNLYEVTTIISLLRSINFTRKNISLQILSPYNGQVEALQSALRDIDLNFNFNPEIQISSVDSFQGKQADIVFISLVRNNDYEDSHNALGFLVDPSRMNVMFSRARYKIIIIGCLKHFNIFSEKSFQEWQKVIKYFQENGIIISTETILKGEGY